MEATDYKYRSYLSAIEAAKYLHISVKMIHELVRERLIKAQIALSGQMRFDVNELKKYEQSFQARFEKRNINIEKINVIEINGYIQRIIVKNSMRMDDLQDGSIHLMVTSPPYFDTKMYSREKIEGDLGNIHDLNE